MQELDKNKIKKAEWIKEKALGFVRDLLSPAMRVSVLKRNGKIINASFQTKVNGIWKTDCSTGLCTLLFFLKKEEAFYINRRLPDRINT
ncbi:MAG: hypothetical protein ABH952_12070 [Candidatus Omnitrophota bacterium]